MKNRDFDISSLTPARRHRLEEWLQQKRSNERISIAIPKRDPSERAALSFAQQRLWFLSRIEQDNPFYNVPVVLQIEGTVDRKALQQSLNNMIKRHESLRTVFDDIDGMPVQIIKTPFELPIEVLDLRELPADERDRAALQIAISAVRQPFDLKHGPLLRPVFICTEEQRQLLVLSIHHIISDGWSTGILIRELTSFYSGYLDGTPVVLPDMHIQYADFAVWQRKWLQGNVLEEHLDYWTDQLRDAPPLLELPTDRARPPIQSFRGDNHVFTLTPELSNQVKTLSRQHDCTLFMTLLTAFNVLLFRYSGQHDLVVGSPIANRTLSDIEGVIGFFVNTLVVRTKLDGQMLFAELLALVRQHTIAAYIHQHLPFERLVEELRPDRNLSYSPIFQVMFALQNTPSVPLTVPDLHIEPLEITNGAALFDLTLSVTDSEQGLICRLEYSTELFDVATIERMAGHWQTLLTEIVSDAYRRVDQLEFMTNVERAQLKAWNATECEVSLPMIHELVERCVAENPRAPAIAFQGQQLSYAELDQRANQLAQHLRRRGVGPEVPVALFMERSIEAVIGILAVLKAGGFYVPLDTSYPPERIAFMLEDSQAQIVLTLERLEGSLPANVDTTIMLDTQWAQIARERSTSVESPATLDNLAYLLYTSGSTGWPKGVGLSHRALSNMLSWHLVHPRLSAPARTLQFSSLSFDVSFQEIFTTWATGGTLVLISDAARRDPRQLYADMSDQDVERLFLPFVALQQLGVAYDEQLPLRLRDVITAGEQLQITPAISGFFDSLNDGVLHNHYGPTESHLVTTMGLTGATQNWPMLPSIGYPISNVQIHILDQQLQPTPIGVPGEIYIAGLCLARGYHLRPALTAERFVPHPFSIIPGDRLYRTGDRGRFLHDGAIESLGRCDQQVKIRGFRIELGEIESVLAHHPAVRDVVVLVSESGSGDRQLVAYLTTHDPAPAVKELRRFVQNLLPDHMIPVAFVTVDSFPLTPSGKLDRRALPKSDQHHLVQTAPYVSPRTDAERALADIWQDVLGVEQVGIHDHFFELGGHSLLATQVAARIRSAFTVDLPLRTLFEVPVLSDLVEAILNGDSATILDPGIERRVTRDGASELISKFDELSQADVDALLTSMMEEREGKQ